MSDDAWKPSPKELERLGRLGPISESDRRFVQIFAAVGHAIDACASSEAVTLLLSTCRNEFLTVNAIFADLKLALSTAPSSDSLFERGIAALRTGQSSQRVLEVRRELGLLMHQAREKRKVWEDRDLLTAEYDDAARDLRGTMRDDALGILRSSPALQDPSGQVWPANYTRVSTQVMHCADRLDELANLTTLCSAAYTMMEKLAALDVPGAPARAVELAAARNAEAETLFGADDKTEEAADAAAIVDWAPIISEARDRPAAWNVRDHASGGVSITVPDLPQSSPDQPWPRPNTVRQAVLDPTTNVGPDSEAQLQLLLDLIDTAIQSARARLRAGFRANVSARPMPDPFLIDLSAQETSDDLAPRSFSLHFAKLISDTQRADSTPVAVLKVAIPEDWHNRQGHYRYNTDIADRDGVRDLILAAIRKAAERHATFLLLPEYFVPRIHLDEVKRAAAKHSVNIIGGVEGRVTGTTCVNEAIMYFPESNVDLVQRKQGPSVYEPRNARFAIDGRLQVLRNTALGNVGVVVCSDFLEADVVHKLAVQTAHRLHALIVVARNPRPEIFTTLAQADAVRLYSNIIVVNSTDGSASQETDTAGLGGCVIAAPHGHDRGLQSPDERFPLPALNGVPNPFPFPELLVWDLPVSGIHARTNRSKDNHWLSPSVFAQQG